MQRRYPKWLEQIPEGRAKEREKDRYILRIAVNEFSRSGTIRPLAEALGVKYETLKSYVNNRKNVRYVPSQVWAGIARELGHDFIAR